MSLSRQPAVPGDAHCDYPTLAAHGASRRRFLRLCALSGAAATLGLQLVGCPSDGGGAVGGGGGGTPVGGNPDWIPWENEVAHVKGKVAMPVGKPIALVIGDAPVAVTFQDGASEQIVVAVTIVPQRGAPVRSEFAARAAKNAELVVKTAKAHPSTVFSDVAALEAFEAALADALSSTITGGSLDSVSVAPIRSESKPESKKEDAERSAPAKKQKAKAAPNSSVAKTVQGTPKAKQLWLACRTPGCTDCGGAK